MTTPRTMLLVRFDEPIQTARPVDELGQLAPLGTDTGLTFPAVVDAFTGKGRLFRAADATGLVARDAAGGSTLSTRDVTIHAIVSIAAGGGSYPRTIVCRGDGSSSAERYAYALELNKLSLPASPTTLELRFQWQTEAGVVKTQAGGTFEYTPDAAYPLAGPCLYLAATRRWVSTTSVVCRYFVNGQLIAEVTSSDGDIGGGTTGQMSFGCRKNGGVYGQHHEGALDELRVDNYECSPEEIRAIWDRFTVHQPNGERALAALMPPGSNWADSSTRWGKLTRAAGQLVGLGWSKIDELRANWLPDRAYLRGIGRWERFLGIAPGGADSLDTRRQRAVKYLQRDNGYAVAQLQDVLAEPLGLAASSIQILEYTNTIADSFASLEQERWFVDHASGLWSITAGKLWFNMNSTNFIRWNGTGFERACCVLPLTSDGRGPGGGTGVLTMLAKLDTFAVGSLATGAIAGIAMYNARSKRLLVFGFADDGGVGKLGYRYFDGTTMGAFVSIENPAPAAPVWLRMQAVHDTAYPYLPTSWKLGWSTTGPTSGFNVTTVASVMPDPEWAGFWVTCQTLTDEVCSVQFDDAVVIDPGGKRPFNWYAFRDPVLAGGYNLALANRMIRSGLRPAHTHGAAIASKSVTCDETDNGLVDHGPMGGL